MPIITANKEGYEFWESSGHIIARSLGPSGLVIEIPVDSVTLQNGNISPKLVGDYIRETISKEQREDN